MLDTSMNSGPPRGDFRGRERSRKKKSAKEFLEYLHSTMDHPVSQRCRIYQLEEIRIRPGETHDELVERNTEPCRPMKLS